MAQERWINKMGSYTKYRKWIELAAVILAVTCVWIYWMNLKTGYSWDELTSYGASNSNYSLWMPTHKGEVELSDIVHDYILGDSLEEFIENISTFIKQTISGGYKSSELYKIYRQYQTQEYSLYWMDKDSIYDYLTVDKGERLNILSIMECDWEDTHPPLYHIALNAVCSLWPGQISKWFGFIINIISLWVVCIFIYGIVKRLRSDHYTALFTVFLYGMSVGAASTVIYIRMYAMLTAMVIALLYQHMRLRDTNYNLNGKNSFFLILNIVLGYLTQYYFCIVAVAIFGVAVFDLFYKKKYSELKKYFICFVVAAGIGLCLWPFGIKHMFLKGRGSEAIAHFGQFDRYFGQVLDFLKITVIQTLTNVCLGFIILVLLVGIFVFLVKKRKLDIGQIYLGVPIAFYVLLVSIVSPEAGTRYISCIFPIVVIGVINIFDLGILKARQAIAIIGAVIYCICAWMTGPDHMEIISVQERTVINEYSDKACVYVEDIYCYQRHLTELAQYDKCLIVSWDNIEELIEEPVELPEEFVLYVSSVIEEDAVINWFIENMEYTKIKVLLTREQEYAGTSIYFVSRSE